MCGIVGFLEKRASLEAGLASLEKMTATLMHRGPDDAGVWGESDSGVFLGHRRLSIVDLSHEGHQPMHSACGRYSVVFNGEIYNFIALRKTLEDLGHTFRGHSDTEVLLSAMTEWGVQKSLENFNGMFAFALWDKREKVLILARDRVGEKPLYYGWMGDVFLFGSELKALRVHPAFRAEVDPEALALYLRYSYVPEPLSIYKGIFKLPPGCLLTVSQKSRQTSDPISYWSARQVAENGTRNLFKGSDKEAADELETLLKEAVALRMVADVPLGALLSGGVDSSMVVALMQAQSSRPVKTFSIGFKEQGFNEAVYAAQVAAHLKTDHTELTVTPEHALEVIPRLSTLYDEPFSDSSQIPTFLVSELARQHVTVGLSGDGGDELFGGYNRYFLGASIWKKVGWLPPALRRKASSLLRIPTPAQWNQMASLLSPVSNRYTAQGVFGDKLHKLADILSVPDTDSLYHRLVSVWHEPTEVLLNSKSGGDFLAKIFGEKKHFASLPDFARKMMFLDLVTYLPDDILAKVDRASMGVSLEVRIPFLDHRVVEFAWRLPLSMKIRKSQSKWLLRQILYKYVPQKLIDRPKMGFGVPIDAWLRGPLKKWAENLLHSRRLEQEGFFKTGPIQEKWREHQSGRRNWQFPLWNILMFQSWFEKWMR